MTADRKRRMNEKKKHSHTVMSEFTIWLDDGFWCFDLARCHFDLSITWNCEIIKISSVNKILGTESVI